MIGKANIEGSKSNVAMNACAVLHASNACGVGKGKAGPGGWGRRRTFEWPAAVLFICLHGVKTGWILYMKIYWHCGIQCHNIYSNFSGTIYLPIFLAPRDSPWGIDDFSYKNLRGRESRFRDIGTWSSCQKNLFSTIWHLFQNVI